MDGLENKRLKIFKRECILAGPRSSILGMYKLLESLGARSNKKDAQALNLLSNKRAQVVLFLRNEGIKGKFPEVLLLNKSWWDYYHNRKKTRSSVITYNIPAKWNWVLANILQLEDIPILIPEDEN